jgi:hypothetical protein
MIYAVVLALIFMAGLYLLALGMGYFYVPLALSGKRSMKIIGILFLASTLEAGGAWFAFKTATPGPALALTAQYATALIAAKIMQYRIEMPYEMSSELVLEDIKSYQNRLVYVVAARAQSSQNFIAVTETIRNDMLAGGCKREDYRALMKLGLAIEMDIHSSNGWGTDPLLLTPKDCKL